MNLYHVVVEWISNEPREIYFEAESRDKVERMAYSWCAMNGFHTYPKIVIREK